MNTPNFKAVVVLTTWPANRDATSLGETLVTEGLAACVNVLPEMRSVYRWRGRIENETERQLVIKTAAFRFGELRRRLREVHTYELPELIALRIDTGDPEVLAWIAATVTPPAG